MNDYWIKFIGNKSTNLYVHIKGKGLDIIDDDYCHADID